MTVTVAPWVPGAGIAFKQHQPRPQIPIGEAPFQTWSQPGQSISTLFFRCGDDYLVRFPELADFLVSATGTEVASWPAPQTQPATLSHLYLNQVLPLALSRQGRLVLHGSAIEVDGYCLAFLGRSGRGKSTLAASFASAGARVLSDDCVRLEWSGDRLLVLPSHPSIRLWDDSRQALFQDASITAPAVSYSSKQRLLAGEEFSFCDEAVPLRRLCLLGDGSAKAVMIRACTASEALVGMASNSFLLDIGEQQVLARHFEEVGAIANLPIHCQLDYPRHYEALPLVREAVLQQAIQESF